MCTIHYLLFGVKDHKFVITNVWVWTLLKNNIYNWIKPDFQFQLQLKENLINQSLKSEILAGLGSFHFSKSPLVCTVVFHRCIQLTVRSFILNLLEMIKSWNYKLIRSFVSIHIPWATRINVCYWYTHYASVHIQSNYNFLVLMQYKKRVQSPQKYF